MPNQNNFRSDITNNTDPKFLASRIVKFPEEGILLEQIPASFGFDTYDFIEVHFYTKQGNNLLLSTTIDAEDADVLKSHVVSYTDGTFKNYIRIDFTKLFEKKQLILIPGDYKLVLNFFSEEIGAYDDRKMYLEIISDSRTEVQVAFADNVTPIKIEENKDAIYEFVEKSFDRANAVGAAEKIFKSGVELEDPTEGLLYQNVIANINVPSINQTFENTIARLNRLGQFTSTQFENELNQLFLKLFEIVREEIVINGDRRIQEDEFKTIINSAVDATLKDLQASVDNRIILS